MMKDIHYNLMESKKTYSILDVADIVFVNPVNTAYSEQQVKKHQKLNFFGINADVKYLAN
jgi:carboxypeptidase C (cathepsin A)